MTTDDPPKWQAHLADILTTIDTDPTDARFTYPIRHGSMRVGVYAPRGHDPQEPHDQDELYIVHKGTGRFRQGAHTVPFGPGDVLFVPAGVDHRFEDFSDDFATWVVFWGPKGGEPMGQELKVEA